jgi:uncharacterized protein with FMN-binding domain
MFWLLSTISCLVLLFGYHTSTSGPLATSASSSIVSGTTPSFSASSRTRRTSGTGAGSTRTTTTKTTGSNATKTSGSSPSKTTKVTGSVVDTQWGPVQLELTVQGSSITKVTVLEYPTGQSQDVQINDYALPILTQETITAQSAKIDMVSGATVTSTGYIESLQSALDRAGI